MATAHEGNGDLPYFEVKECFAGTIVNGPGFLYGPRMQVELQLLAVHSGFIDLSLDEQKMRIVPGQIILILPGRMVHIISDRHEDTWHRWVTVKTFEIEDDVLRQLNELPTVLPLSDQMSQLFDVLVSLQRQDLSGTNAVRHTLALAAFQLYAEECRHGSGSIAHPFVAAAKSLIYERFHEELSLVDLAAVATVSTGHFIRLFRQYEGMTPTKYLWLYRVERGVEWLRTTDLSIGEIAARCGFKTSYHFARMVKERKGKSPTEIRNMDAGSNK